MEIDRIINLLEEKQQTLSEVEERYNRVAESNIKHDKEREEFINNWKFNNH